MQSKREREAFSSMSYLSPDPTIINRLADKIAAQIPDHIP